MSYTRSEQLFERAKKSIPGGVNSPVRAFKNVGGTPLFIKKAKGAYVYDEDDNKYIDYVGSWGPMILGHAYDPVVEAVQITAENSTSFGAPTELEIGIAELIRNMAPNVDKIRMVNSGTEACMSAVRLARGFTKRDKIIKFEGCYHGHADMFLVKAGSGVATFGIQEVPGVTAGIAQDTLTAPYNDIDAVEKLVADHPDEIAAIIVEPVAGNMGCVLPKTGFLEGLRRICTKKGIVLILDEVMTGFRLARGGAQEKLMINADLVTFGKVIGGGLPVGAFAGKEEIMNHIAPVGEVYQAGTLSGNPLAMAAGYTLLKELNENEHIYEELAQKGSWLAESFKHLFAQFDIPAQVNHMGSMMSVFFTNHPVTNFEESAASDHEFFKKFFHGMLRHGIYLPPSGYESWFLSNALSFGDLKHTIEEAGQVLEELKK